RRNGAAPRQGSSGLESFHEPSAYLRSRAARRPPEREAPDADTGEESLDLRARRGGLAGNRGRLLRAAKADTGDGRHSRCSYFFKINKRLKSRSPRPESQGL